MRKRDALANLGCATKCGGDAGDGWPKSWLKSDVNSSCVRVCLSVWGCAVPALSSDKSTGVTFPKPPSPPLHPHSSVFASKVLGAVCGVKCAG